MFTAGFQYKFYQIKSQFFSWKMQLVASNMLLFWCSRSKYRLNKLDLVIEGRTFYIHFSLLLGSVFDCVKVNPSTPMVLKPCLV